MTALDWMRAFDSINTGSLLNALRRFGLPVHFCNVVRAIYTDRAFVVSECGEASTKHCQNSGICRGYPLSPFLFGIVMTLLMEDAVNLLPDPCRYAVVEGKLYDILYADDTLRS